MGERNSENGGPEHPEPFGPRETVAVFESDTGRRIGAYRLLQRIGEGGMGEVWLAEQLEPWRKVAIKLIKPGMDTKQVLARFESERQALALMDHPAIAKVFDGGSTGEGRPYFVMEYVSGVPITEHCDANRLSTAARLELFSKVCEGVQHAHQKAIIHRDLKPSNILVSLVDGRAQAKIIDFGIAKATGYRLTEKTLFTERGAIIGTPEYMSPEQADLGGQDVDTRTDVYSLGVILYQLLTGELPFGSKELRSSSYEELRRKLREVEPPRPSAKLHSLGDGAADAARRRDTDAGGLRKQLEGDVDAINMKALEKERARRYGTPSELIADIARHLRHEPVVARPPSLAYRIGKYIRRHRLGVGVAMGLAVLLLAFAATMAVQARRTAVERDRANRERETSDKVSAFLASMLNSLKPDALGDALWKDLHQRVAAARRSRGAPEERVAATLASLDEALVGVNLTGTAVHLLDEQILDRAGKTLEQDTGADPKLAGRLEHTLGTTYRDLGLYPQAEAHFNRAVEVRARAFGPEDPETLLSKNGLANVYMETGRPEEAEKLHGAVLEARRKALGADNRDTLYSMNNLAEVYMLQGRYADAEKLQREVLEGERRVLGPEHPDTLDGMLNLAEVYEYEGRYAEAETLAHRGIEIRQRVQGPETPTLLLAINNLAGMYRKEGRFAEAEKLHRDSLEGLRRMMGPSHPWTLAAMEGLAEDVSGQGRYAEAEKLFRETLEARQRVLGAEHPDTLESLSGLAGLYDDQGRYAEAEQLARRAVTGYEQMSWKNSEQVGDAHLALGRALLGLKRYSEADTALLAAEPLLSTAKGVQYRKCLDALVRMYGAWELSEPGQGHSTQLATWKAKLDGSQ
jgi:non-specific serine/threonine protein kinase/serine/threonine-protein kinase